MQQNHGHTRLTEYRVSTEWISDCFTSVNQLVTHRRLAWGRHRDGPGLFSKSSPVQSSGSAGSCCSVEGAVSPWGPQFPRMCYRVLVLPETFEKCGSSLRWGRLCTQLILNLLRRWSYSSVGLSCHSRNPRQPLCILLPSSYKDRAYSARWRGHACIVWLAAHTGKDWHKNSEGRRIPGGSLCVGHRSGGNLPQRWDQRKL